MTRPVPPNLANTLRSPVPEAYGWLEGKTFPPERPLLNVSQAAPADPPPESLRQAMADAILGNDATHLYGPVLGMDALKNAVAQRWSREHSAVVGADQVAITSGCNQAFAAVIATLASPGDEVIIPAPWYFNHKMWLDMSGVKAVPLPVGPDMLPDATRARALVTDRTRAIVLVSPNNPTGAEYPAGLIRDFFYLSKSCGISLILDETYRDFLSRGAPPHDLFNDPDWDQTLIQLYSFSKVYRLTGHRVGAMTTSQSRLKQAEKFLDTVTICPSQIGQFAALWGMNYLGKWLEGERREIAARRQAIRDGFGLLEDKGWDLLGLGGFFAYVRFPQPIRSDIFARQLVETAHVLALPGTMFAPEGTKPAESELRLAFANIDRAGITQLFQRLSTLPT